VNGLAVEELPTRSIGDFDIDIVFTTPIPSQEAQDAFLTAAELWESVLLGDIQDVNVSGIGFVDDIRIEARFQTIDGNGGILGSAGPTALRNSNALPAAGRMTFDTADVQSLVAAGNFEDVVVHEMGHVLGVGTIWGTLGLRAGTGTNSVRFTGSNAVAAYNEQRNTDTTSVPVENTGGGGTRDSHWRESVFGRELMTGFLNFGQFNPLSRLTAASMIDLGYPDVNLDAAETYVLPNGNFPPSVSGFIAAPSSITTQNLLLRVNSVSDGGGVRDVRFWRESNDIPGLQSGTSNPDTLVGTDTSASGGWSVTVPNSSIPVGESLYYARARDLRNLPSGILEQTATKEDAAAPPVVVSSFFNIDAGQPTVEFTFDTNVAPSISATDVLITSGPFTLPSSEITTSYDPTTNTAFYAINFAALGAANYTATLQASEIAAGGTNLENDATQNFYYLAGDANRDRSTNLADFLVLRSNFNSTGAIFSDGDFNYDGSVNLSDFLILRANFNQSVPAGSPFAFGLGGGGDDDNDRGLFARG
ncbi:MAG: leishmanolysin-related zinc metalloendopeptidase, partial [Planctomycetota bacterium]